MTGNDHGEFEDLAGVEVLKEALEQVVVDREMLDGVTLGVLDRHLFGVGVVRVLPIVSVQVGVQLFGDFMLRRRRSPKVQSDGTVVDLGDPHADQLAKTERKPALVVDRVGQTLGGLGKLGTQGPKPLPLGSLTVRKGYASHALILPIARWKLSHWLHERNSLSASYRVA
jgi:hypothetical protein